MLNWIRQSVARQAALVVAGSLTLAALGLWFASRRGLLASLSSERFLCVAVLVIAGASSFAGLLSSRFLGARLALLVRVIDGTGSTHDDLARIRNLGPDEVGAIGHAVNRLLARVTSIRASMIDQERELLHAQRELALKESLAQKTEELAHRLEERAMLFDILRMTTSSQELEQVLHTLVERVGQLLKLREAVLFIHDESSEEFVVRAAYGFPREEAVVGRSLKAGEGVSGRVGKTREPVVVDDVSREETYLGFWGHAERAGSLAAVPILYQEQLLGVLTVTRSEHDLTEMHLNLLSAIADNASLAIRNAQLFTRMRELSTQDELTGLANRRLFHSKLSSEIDRARRFEHPLSLIAIDIDHFKQLNDRHGHPVGDAALREVAALFARSVRKIDTVARVGGEEFMILLPRADIQEAALVAGKLQKAVLAYDFPGAQEQPGGRLTVSLGVAQLAPTDERDGEGLIGRADSALYAAKHAGRNRVFVVDAPHAVESTRPPSD